MKRKLAIVLIISMVLACFVPRTSVQAATNTATLVVNTLELMDTDKTIGGTVTRAQFAQILVNLSQSQNSVVKESNVSLYPDVKNTHWAAGYIRTAVKNGWMFANLTGYFRPDNAINLQEAVYGILGVLGYSSSDFVGGLSSGVMSLYVQKELNDNITLAKNGQLTKTTCVQLLYNALKAKTKSGNMFGESFNCVLDSTEEISYLKLVDSNLEGPIIVQSNWMITIPLSLNSAKIYRNDKVVAAKSIMVNDVMYYSKSLNTVLAYSTKVTGTVKKITSTTLLPESVTIGNNTYTFENDTIAQEFSIYGSVNLGDFITVLLGKDGKIAGIKNMENSSMEYAALLLSMKENNGSINGSSSDYAITVVDASGQEYQYDYDGIDSYSAGAMVNVTIDSEGATFASLLYGNQAGMSGTVNSTATKLGSYSFADDVVILDTVGDNYVSVFPSRLAGVVLDDNDIKYYKLNDNGEIAELILEDVTGDCYSYGLVTSSSYKAGDYSYTYDLDGSSYTASPYSATAGDYQGCAIYTNEGTVENIMELEVELVESLEDGVVTMAKQSMRISDDIKYYYYNAYNGSYEFTNLETLDDLDDYTLLAYYDEDESHGGRVRVIVAEKKNS